jgi:hypothetical protein
VMHHGEDVADVGAVVEENSIVNPSC